MGIMNSFASDGALGFTEFLCTKRFAICNDTLICMSVSISMSVSEF